MPMSASMAGIKPVDSLTAEERKEGEWLIAKLDVILMTLPEYMECNDTALIHIAAREAEQRVSALRDAIQKYGREVGMSFTYHVGNTRVYKIMDQIKDLDLRIDTLMSEKLKGTQQTLDLGTARESCIVCYADINLGDTYCSECFIDPECEAQMAAISFMLP